MLSPSSEVLVLGVLHKKAVLIPARAALVPGVSAQLGLCYK